MTTQPRPDPAVEAVIAVLSDDGWTCEYHEPDQDCAECARAHRATAEHISAAVRAAILAPILALADEMERNGQDVSAWVLRSAVGVDLPAAGTHVERPTVMAGEPTYCGADLHPGDPIYFDQDDGQLYCSCGRRWPCTRAVVTPDLPAAGTGCSCERLDSACPVHNPAAGTEAGT